MAVGWGNDNCGGQLGERKVTVNNFGHAKDWFRIRLGHIEGRNEERDAVGIKGSERVRDKEREGERGVRGFEHGVQGAVGFETRLLPEDLYLLQWLLHCAGCEKDEQKGLRQLPMVAVQLSRLFSMLEFVDREASNWYESKSPSNLD
ncbi:hypothetical protein BHM03_00011922 [Ensete ventricosum]|nr:hypothetical protein BHM03_00011922 [Ensete ventricosum]